MLLIAFCDNLFVVESSLLVIWLLLIMHRRNSCQIQCHEAVFLCLLKGFVISALLGLVCFELTLMCGRTGRSHFLTCGYSASPTALVVGRHLALHTRVCFWTSHSLTGLSACLVLLPFEVRPWETFSFVLVALFSEFLIRRNFMLFISAKKKMLLGAIH